MAITLPTQIYLYVRMYVFMHARPCMYECLPVRLCNEWQKTDSVLMKIMIVMKKTNLEMDPCGVEAQRV